MNTFISSVHCIKIQTTFFLEISWQLFCPATVSTWIFINTAQAAAASVAVFHIFLTFLILLSVYLNNELVHFENKCYTQRISFPSSSLVAIKAFNTSTGKNLDRKCCNILYSWHISNVLKYFPSLNSFRYSSRNSFIYYLLSR